MRAVVISGKGQVTYKEDYNNKFKLKTGQVLIKVEAAVINPSDLYRMQGDYDDNDDLYYPNTAGVEGSGTVTASGGGFMANRLVGKRVGFVRGDEYGSYGEYSITKAMQCIPLDDKISWEQGACSFVNPVTAVGLLDVARKHNVKACIQNGAASQLGRMIIRLFKEQGIPLINIVRREEQVTLLKEKYGADYVLNSTDENFDKELYNLSKQLKCNVALECVAGKETGRLIQCLSENGVCINYGKLSEEDIGPINPIVFIFRCQRLESFFLPTWLESKWIW
mmetsp:Transcript_30831/g.47228  ORF Transcript_30831/g.47228 Transcript_30831/m.47228 type:complete len:280 (+) Transcript_30831:26-865(+)